MRVRDAFFEKIYEKTKAGEDIIIVSSDIGAPSLDDFRKDFPERFVNVGIAEQNSIAVAGGLALAGKKVITYGLNPFPVTRAFDQVRNILSALEIPITVTALNAGTCSAEAGYTHIAVENMSIMRTLNNVVVINPSDTLISERLVDELLNNPKPRYVQFDKYIDGNWIDDNSINFEYGFVSEGEGDIAVVTYGIHAHELRKHKVNAKVIDCYCLPINENKFIDEMKGISRIITVEDSVASGGIGSMVLEILNDNGITIPVERMAINKQKEYSDLFLNREMMWQREEIDMENLFRKISGRA